MNDFETLVQDLGFTLNKNQKKQFLDYYHFLVEENEHINLTSITDFDGVFLKHFYDSLTIEKIGIKNGSSICDIGAGAGFPSIPLKILDPSLKVTIIDSLQKRCLFLERLIKKLDLKDVLVIWGRAEEQKGQYDIVSARAVARLNILDELCIPLVKVGGRFVAMKSMLAQTEIMEASKGISVLGGVLQEPITFSLPIEGSNRTILVVNKVKETPSKYPRKFSVIKKMPL